MNIHLLSDPWAPHPIVNRHICFGGGGGGETYTAGNAPSVPDYSKYIEAMTSVGNQLTGYGKDLYDWAKQAGVKVSEVADRVGARAGELADSATQTYKDSMAKWKSTYEPLYDAQAADAQRMIGDLPGTEERYAGKYSADVAQAFDASKAAQDRQLRSYGLKAPGSGAQQLDAVVSNQRRLGQVAASEQGRLAARTEARDVTGRAIQSGLIYPELANKSSALALSAGNQEVGAPESAISTTVGAYAPALNTYSAAMPWMKTWGDTMATSYNQALQGYSAQEQAKMQAAKTEQGAGGSGIGSMLGGVLGTAAGAYFGGPMGAKLGGSLGSSIGGAAGGGGGSGSLFEEGGSVDGGDQVVTPDMSQSQGAITDDVPARLNVGEFVLPKDVVAWMGEEKLQKLIQTTRAKRESQTVAEAETAPRGAIDMQPPQFVSGGASV